MIVTDMAKLYLSVIKFVFLNLGNTRNQLKYILQR